MIKNKKLSIFIFFTFLFILILILFLLKDKILEILNPVTIIKTVNTVDLKQTDGRTNILILGTDIREKSNIGNNLTDTILVASIGKIDKDVVLISLPRDLWVKWEDTNFNQRESKINAIYPNVYGGSDTLIKVINQVLDLEIHYYATINFKLFEDAINTLGGVEINVENSFTDYKYPIEGKENDPIIENRYQTISFEKGVQTMNGETALKYSRSRNGDNNEGTDFARAKRQQNVIEGIKNKLFNTKTILDLNKLQGLFENYKNNVDTNLTLFDIQSFYVLSHEIEFNNVISVVLDDRSSKDDGGLLYAPTDTKYYDGQYVLLPKTNDFSQIHAYVQKFLFAK